MRYGEGLIAEILHRTDLVQLVGRRVKLERRGRVFWGLCPFHKEKSPSFKVEHERRNYKCFGCGAGGDAFKWLMETEGLLFPEAVERLAQEAGVELPGWTPQDESREQQKKTLYAVVEEACVYFEQQLRAPAGTAARTYLLSRGLNEDVWRQFRLGYAPSGRSALVTCLKANGATTEDLVAAGLARSDGDGHPARDFFFDRVIFPIGDLRGRVVAFGARALVDGVQPKYVNTGETALFSKGRLLYNFASARMAGLKSGVLIVAEGYLDVIALACSGFAGAVAPLGTALTSDQLALLWRISAEPILSFDGDEAGTRAAARAARLAMPMLSPGHSLRFALLPLGEDPDSLIRTRGADTMRAVLDRSMPLAELVWRTEIEGRSFDSPERKAALVSSLNEKLKLIASDDVRRFYLDTMADRIAREFGIGTYVRDSEIHASGRPFKKSKAGSRGALAAHNRSGSVSSALMGSKLVSLARGKRVPDANGTDPAGIRLIRTPPPVAPRQSAADGCGDPGLKDNAAARWMKEAEVLTLLIDAPEILDRCHEMLAVLPLANRSLDRLRNELLNVAVSGFRLETGGLEDHLVRAGMAALVERLKAQRAGCSAESGPARMCDGGEADAAESEARWLCAAAQLREMAEVGPERRQALERLKSEASEESWRDWHRLRTSTNPG
ncbi:MAG TPA: DNA primase [Rhizomicrobium sp.]|jgi:DNA primase|nr:DNA primase [Rhizomicrobium sp.]